MQLQTFTLKVKSNDGVKLVLIDANGIPAITYTAETPEEFAEIAKFKVGEYAEATISLPDGQLTIRQIPAQ